MPSCALEAVKKKTACLYTSVVGLEKKGLHKKKLRLGIKGVVSFSSALYSSKALLHKISNFEKGRTRRKTEKETSWGERERSERHAKEHHSAKLVRCIFQISK